MRRRLEPWLQAIWYGDRPVPLGLRALAALYGGINGVRRALYRGGVLRSQRAPVPVVVVGNLTAGGSGKTPTLIALARALLAQGRRPGLLSRGYGGRYRAHWQAVTAASDPAEVGDEPVLLARETGCPVVVARRRVLGIAPLLAAGVDLILCDDGLQHLALARDLELIVVHGGRRHGNGRLLPAGPLRERAATTRAVPHLVLVQGGAPAPDEHALGVQLLAPQRLHDGQQRPWVEWQGQPVQALAGIADPQRFFAMLEAHGLQVRGHPFPDHHAYQPADLDVLDPSLPCLCTAKDAVKLTALDTPPELWEVPLAYTIPEPVLHAVLSLSCTQS